MARRRIGIRSVLIMRLHLYYLILFALAFSWPSPVPEVPAIDLEQLSPESREVIAPYLQKARQDPSDHEAYGKLGMVLQAFELYREATDAYHAAEALAPEDFRWSYLLAIVGTRLGNTAGAVNDLRRTLEIRPNYEPAILRLAETLLATNELKESLSLFNRLLEKRPDSVIALYGRGRALLEEGRSEEAVRDLERAVDLSPEFGSAHYSLALAYRDLGRKEEAGERMKLYQQYRNQWPVPEDDLLAEVQKLKSAPQDLISLGVKLAKENRYQDAIEMHLRAVEKDPDLAQAHANLLQLYARTGNTEKAIEHYTRAIEITPDFYESHYNYGVLMLQKGDQGEARRAFEEVVRINPYHADGWNNLGILQMSSQEFEAAADSFTQALQNEPRHSGARFNLGRVLVALERLEEARQAFESLAQETEGEDLPRYLYALAAVRVRMGDVEDGIKLATRARDRALEKGQTELAGQIEKSIRRLAKDPSFQP